MVFDGARDRVALEVGDLGARDGDLGDVSFIEKHDLARVLEKGRHVRRQERLALAEADDQRRRHLRGDDLARVLVGDHRQRVGAVHLAQRHAHRAHQRRRALLQRLVDEVGDDLGVGLREEPAPRDLEPRAQRQVVLDDAVVNHGDRARPGAGGRWPRTGARGSPSACDRRPRFRAGGRARPWFRGPPAFHGSARPAGSPRRRRRGPPNRTRGIRASSGH